jgi:hypothetical protein
VDELAATDRERRGLRAFSTELLALTKREVA